MRNNWAGEFKRVMRRIETERDEDGRLVHDFETAFLDDRIGEHFLGNFFEVLLGFFARPAVKIQYKEFALANIGDGRIAETGEGMMNSLTLRVENGALWHDPNVGFHRESIAGQQGG